MAHDFNYRKLVEARERAGLKMAEAARQAGFSRQELHRYENNRRLPNAIRFLSLMKVYRVKDVNGFLLDEVESGG